MNILVVGNGGREHAICKKILASPLVSQVYCAPGNQGMIRDGIQSAAIDSLDFSGLAQFAKEKQVSWTFVGPEQPLVLGIVDYFQQQGLTIFGPNQAGAQLEGSKRFAKDFMAKYQIPTADYASFNQLDEAVAYVSGKNYPLVIKADGLAAGKGVVIVNDEPEAVKVLTDMLVNHQFGESSAEVIVEEFLVGEEFSYLALVHRGQIFPLKISQDHKQVYNGDAGPNTGGMGAYCPVPQIPSSVIDRGTKEVLEPTIQGLKAEGIDFSGVLYAGLIATEQGPKVIEFNVRMGDPETQVILEQMSSDLAEVIDAILRGETPQIEWYQDQISLGVVVAAKGYPDSNYVKHIPLPNFPHTTNVQVYFSGVDVAESGELISCGGRIFMVVAKAHTVKEAQKLVYDYLGRLPLPDCHFRTDIGFKAIENKSNES